MKQLGLYVHIPFCKQKCLYCDFTSFDSKHQCVEEYMKWIKLELLQVADGNKSDYKNGIDDLIQLSTIYIGGGTPSIINSKHIIEIIELIKNNFEVAENVEITIEINPGTVDKTKLQDYFNCGINRLSIGLQSTNNELLKTIGRIHTYQDFENTYTTARNIGFKNINVDLMIGLPNQTCIDIEKELEDIIYLKPEHISVYSLIVEEGTKLEQLVSNNKLQLPDEEIERKMYWMVKHELEEAGYKHYEISNFAKPGYESKHNSDCWNQKEYIGIGIAAHSYTNGVRYSNIDSLEKYIENYQTSKELDNLIFHEKQNQESMMKEYMMLGLRKIDGISIKEFKAKFIENPIYVYRKQLERLVKQQLLEIEDDSIRLTTKGIDFANLVWEEFV